MYSGRFLFLVPFLSELALLSIGKALKHQPYVDFQSGENDLLRLDTQIHRTTPFPAPIIPEVVLHPAPQTTPLTFAQSQQILANRLLYNGVQGFASNNNGAFTTASPKDPFIEEDPSSGQQIQQQPRLNGNVSPMLLNERLMAAQMRPASVNELPLPLQQLPKPIVPEVVVRGAAIQDSRLPMMRNGYRSACQPFL